LAEAHLEAGRTAEAEQFIAQAIPDKSPDAQLQHALLRARLTSVQGRADEAELLFKELISRRRSEGPRYYYSEHLMDTGRQGEGTAILKDILLQYRRGTVVWRHQERKWFYAAKRLLKRRMSKD
jgi:hypothetical protein